jgi:hypothetical protein
MSKRRGKKRAALAVGRCILVIFYILAASITQSAIEPFSS